MVSRSFVRTLVTVLFSSVAIAACNDEEPAKLCVPGKSEACVGEGGCAGGQACNAEGTGFGACACGSTNPSDSGTPTQDAGTQDAGQHNADAGQDGGAPDAGGGTCNPLGAPGQQGCSTGQKCTWIRISDTPTEEGRLGCVPNGTATLGQMCSQGPVGETTGFDDCVERAICINSMCSDVCGFDAASDAGCGPDGACTQYSGLFHNGTEDPVAGACVPKCDPITQGFSDGGSCGVNKGCYLLTTSTTTLSVCASAGTIEHNELVTGTAFANVCVPGHQPRGRSDGGVECGALCAPADVTTMTNTASESGVAPNNCEARSASSSNPAAAPSNATAGESCRYWWSRESFNDKSPFSNTVGWCFKHATFQYDTNGDQMKDAPFPRCSDVTTGDVIPPVENPPGNDALYFWCVARNYGNNLFGPAQRPSPLREPALDRLGGWRN